MTNLSPRMHIAVVGAGISGLSCAQTLVDAGHHVQVFDKSRGPSGRMSTRRAEDAQGPWQCDHGAQYFTARDPAFRAQVARWQHAGVAALWGARLASFDGNAWTTPHTALERYVGTPRMTSPAAWQVERLGPRARTQWQTTVQGVQRQADGWALSSAEQGAHRERFDAVVLAVPAPQAVPLLNTIAPAGAALAAGARMRGSWAVMLRYESAVEMPWDGAFINAGPLRWVARDSSKPGRTGQETWLLHATADWSEAHIEDEADSVTATLLAAFAALGGPPPAAASAHRWRFADTEPALTVGCWWDAKQQLGLCGDWLHGGKVEGAWLSGRMLAQQVTAFAAAR